MKLSIISPNINNSKILDDFLDDLKNQENQDFEIILSLNSLAKSLINVVQKHFATFGSRLKFILNNHKIKYQEQIFAAFEMVKADYFTIINYENKLRSSYILRLVEKIDSAQTDIIEIKPRFIDEVTIKPKGRIKENLKFDLKEHPEIIAFSFPTITNKIFKKNLIQNLQTLKLENLVDNKFALIINYLLLINAKTYQYFDKRIIREKVDKNISINLDAYQQEWQFLNNYLLNNDIQLANEIAYAKKYFFNIWLMAFIYELSSTRLMNKTFHSKTKERFINALQKLIQLVQKEQEKDINFYNTNVYLINNSNLNETKFIKSKITKKLIKEIFNEL
ncbi:glycosyltransferase [Mycoplasmopsis gallinarum]